MWYSNSAFVEVFFFVRNLFVGLLRIQYAKKAMLKQYLSMRPAMAVWRVSHKRRCRNENENHIGVQRVQAEKLQYNEGQEEYAGQA